MNECYLLDYWRIWERFVGEQNGIYVVVQLTPINGWHSPRDVVKVTSETLLAREYVEKERGPFPEVEYKEMVKHLGAGFADKLLNFDYLSEVTPEQVKGAMYRSSGGGVPFQFVKDWIQDPTKFYQRHA